ncbi:MAG: flavin reductase family protein [Alphaproteobacteria bacterium]|nr:MAG: flavin reductase family protein [Alphaproteobacteria bacterium]
MFYETARNDHGLPHDPFKSCIVPRPIGWITTLSRSGVVNLAPYSFFNGVASDPPMVMFACLGPEARPSKDTLINCEQTGEFVCNMATWDLREAMNRTSAAVPHGTDEMALAGLESAPSRLVGPPRVKDAPIHLECTVHQIVDLPCTDPGGRNAVVIGRVVGVHIRDDVLSDGRIDMAKVRPIARLGYMDYTSVDHVFTMLRPEVEPASS